MSDNKLQWTTDPERIKEINERIRQAANKDSTSRKLRKRIAAGLKKVSYGITYVKNSPRFFDREGILQEAISTGASEAKAKFDTVENELKAIRMSAMAGTLLDDYEFESFEHVIDTLMKLGMDRDEADQVYRMLTTKTLNDLPHRRDKTEEKVETKSEEKPTVVETKAPPASAGVPMTA